MADSHGFLTYRERELPPNRPVPVRIADYREIRERRTDGALLKRQASRCMDCGVPFCMAGCPLGNIIPEFNDYARQGLSGLGAERLLATNNFPEFTGRICPAPCESSCVLGINQPPVTIKAIERALADDIVERGMTPQIPGRLSDRSVCVVGSGPAGLAAAQQLTRAGHTVVVYERDDRLGGLLRYGIPDFKLEKHIIDARLDQMRAEGTRFRTGVEIGVDLSWTEVRERFDAVIVATGALAPRDLDIPGRHLDGVHQAMEFLTGSNREVAGAPPQGQVRADGKHVVVLGGGDTGSDCIGVSHRQGAASVTNVAIGIRPPDERAPHEPWPIDPRLFETQPSHEEGGERVFLTSTVEFVDRGDGSVGAIRVADTQILPNGQRIPTPGTERDLPADLVLLSLGFTGTDANMSGLDLPVGRGSLIARSSDYSTDLPGVFVAGDAGRGASLVVWAIAEGRAVAHEVDAYISGSSSLPSPTLATSRGLHL
ncbi:glutamate synthase subunit beta [Flaviflexus salsibiostraticola]|uniref:Glutamate synthase subunit beta n=1 Tax=Flaviflexus salsibiostraticola TaxID=1282737 RepID=A0A3Q8WTG3_9ACTO|nr:glutamate synthase subunit beta [Flaviflexus salsibiostraticola]AZN29737.1 glutamate synthase subunit beta [Flaviflexus salsibiostraticola]